MKRLEVDSDTFLPLSEEARCDCGEYLEELDVGAPVEGECFAKGTCACGEEYLLAPVAA